ncbi:hypothetical protein FIBSPDRAFT_853844 [Athelia psychrophila]|uniref:Uncharacterized protein n=1 Tax=Athelia psychrophila TaxID=1759441 RepID=A0A166QHS5_9AGAM|nr:hypothetical protein FIBSPDRAFT_853844 [Fibularhizoctonia sp. CBS 109695]
MRRKGQMRRLFRLCSHPILRILNVHLSALYGILVRVRCSLSTHHLCLTSVFAICYAV